MTSPPRPWQRLVRRPAEDEPSSVRRFRQRARERRITHLRPWLAAGAVLALLAVVGWIVYGSPVLGVQTVRVAGNSLVSADDVRAAAAIRPGTPLAGLDTAGIGRRVVAGLLPVRVAKVDRNWPGSVVITVTERVGVAVVALPDKQWLLLDATAVGFLRVGTPPASLAVLVLANPGPADASTVAALSVLAALTPQLRERLVRIEAPAPDPDRLEADRWPQRGLGRRDQEQRQGPGRHRPARLQGLGDRRQCPGRGGTELSRSATETGLCGQSLVIIGRHAGLFPGIVVCCRLT